MNINTRKIFKSSKDLSVTSAVTDNGQQSSIIIKTFIWRESFDNRETNGVDKKESEVERVQYIKYKTKIIGFIL